jgi:FKBP-type peptidyl-prolyl cis-trans isomerase
MKWIRLLSASTALVAWQAGAQAATDATTQGGAASQAESDKGGRISPRQRAEYERADLAQHNASAEPGYLAANKARPGVVTLASGVQYRVLIAGSGTHPSDANTVLCRYQGAVAGGDTFDMSDAKTPSALKVSGLLPGLREAVKLMAPGARWEVVVPPELGYGAHGAGGVGPNAVLVYTIELVGIR